MKKIIVADASPTIKSVADSLLRQHGYNVICTSDGLQAWEVIQAERPDLVLAGLNLSGISGLELSSHVFDKIVDSPGERLMVPGLVELFGSIDGKAADNAVDDFILAPGHIRQGKGIR